MKKYKVIDLFSGSGGLSNGFEQTDKYKVVIATEKNKNARMTFQVNHCPEIIINEDVVENDYPALMKSVNGIDVVIGGPPCQGFSNANRQKNHLISSNNELVKEYIRAVKEIQPKAFVMENVKMLSSSTHKFFISEENIDEINKMECIIHQEEFEIEFLAEIKKRICKDVREKREFRKLLLSEHSLTTLSVLTKSQNNKNKYEEILLKKRKDIDKLINESQNMIMSINDDIYGALMIKLLSTISHTLDRKSDKFKSVTSDLLILQRLFNKLEELRMHKIIIDDLRVENCNLILKVSSITVLDYIINSLNSDYSIGKGVLNAVNFGVPQYRERYIIIGVNKSIIDEIDLPLPKGNSDAKYTVSDAISDLEEHVPFENVEDDKSIKIRKTKNHYRIKICSKGGVYNHIITKSGLVAKERFKKLKQGQNFHDLHDEMKTTYAEPSRTQNSIYLRLDYDKPSNTVTNVRKSMWIHPIIDRAISIREAARLQSFPDGFRFMGTKDSQYQQVGNAVPPMLGKAIAEHLLELLRIDSKDVKLDS